ncbi:5-oxoprolinase subunit PxpB [Pedobacter frigoris]|uniref:5-oxoprolinase subunit PxpB n=2 Tax=Pedobacter frigoris TaxID=2571272 RepID=A0A4U1CE36_9SPHI|nr:5-oxoprolinase subunit PxpB [Pedobacter frigoris]
MSNITDPNIVQYYPLGDAAIVLQFGDEISKDINAMILNVAAWLDEYTFEGFVEYVPAFTSITIYYEPWVVRYSEVLSMLKEMIEDMEENENPEPPGTVTIPVYYGGASGPDLNHVADFHQMSVDEVIAMHTQPEYLVYMIGFAPGFPYLGGMDERLATPRQESPRAKVPKGSVGIAGSQTGVYPLETPGGWQVIGQTPLELFDLSKEEPALLRAGQKIRFSPITEEEFLKIKADHGH